MLCISTSPQRRQQAELTYGPEPLGSTLNLGSIWLISKSKTPFGIPSKGIGLMPSRLWSPLVGGRLSTHPTQEILSKPGASGETTRTTFPLLTSQILVIPSLYPSAMTFPKLLFSSRFCKTKWQLKYLPSGLHCKRSIFPSCPDLSFLCATPHTRWPFIRYSRTFSFVVTKQSRSCFGLHAASPGRVGFGRVFSNWIWNPCGVCKLVTVSAASILSTSISINDSSEHHYTSISKQTRYENKNNSRSNSIIWRAMLEYTWLFSQDPNLGFIIGNIEYMSTGHLNSVYSIGYSPAPTQYPHVYISLRHWLQKFPGIDYAPK